MPVRRWHIGKLVLLWAWGAVLILLALAGVQAVPSNEASWTLLGWLLVFLAVAVPVGLSVITWIWLGGREDSGQQR